MRVQVPTKLTAILFVGLVGHHGKVSGQGQDFFAGPQGDDQLKVETSEGSIKVSKAGSADTLNAHNAGRVHMMTFKVGNGDLIQIETSPLDQEMSVRKLGKSKMNGITLEDKKFLNDLALNLQKNPDQDTDMVDSIAFQSMRMAMLLANWPADMEIDFTFDKEKEMDRMEKRAKEVADHPIPDDAPGGPGGGRRLTEGLKALSPEVVNDENGHRRLAYTTICDKLYTWVYATHDDWSYDRGDDQSSCYVWPGPFANCGSADGTWFWTGKSRLPPFHCMNDTFLHPTFLIYIFHFRVQL
jgi:translation initiation factor IF-1